MESRPPCSDNVVASAHRWSKNGFLLHAEPYVGSSGSSDSINFDNEFLFSALAQFFFDLCTDTAIRILRKALSLHLWIFHFPCSLLHTHASTLNTPYTRFHIHLILRAPVWFLQARANMMANTVSHHIYHTHDNITPYLQHI